jgi:uncharacterized membrane protein
MLFLLAFFLAVRTLMSLILKRRDGLHGLLVEHVKQAMAEQRKKRQIIEFRKKKRMQIAKDAAAKKNEGSDEMPAKAA